MHDPINLLEAPAVPIVVAIDEYGIVRAVRPRSETFAAEFLDKTFVDDAPPGAPRSSGPPDTAALLRKAEASPTADARRAAGDARLAQAKSEVARRGEVPAPLAVEPYGWELAGPARDVVGEAAPVEPDPKGRIHRDEERFIEAEVAVVPTRVRPGQAARVHVTFRPSAAHKARWNNESAPLRVWVAGAEFWTMACRPLEPSHDDQPDAGER